MALLVAIFIAIPFAIFISKYKRDSEISLQIAGIMQTIPSLALLGLFIPVFGIGRLPAIIVLIIYAIFHILQNTITGLNEIDPSLQEAATAFGMTRMEKLKKFELEIAMPVIISGVRASAVMIIGTATLAALIGAGGLGSFILLGIDRNNTSLILIGAISSAVLAILFGFAIKYLEKRRLKTILISLLAVIVLLTSTFFMGGMGGSDSLVIAGKLGAEPEILMNMYKELIEDKTDIDVEVRPNFGKTTFLFEAIKAGSIDIYPEFTGTVVSSLLNDVPEYSNDSREVYELARDRLLEESDMAFLEPMEFQNTYALAVKNSYAEENGLETIRDLKRLENSLTAGFTLEFNDREDGNLGLQELYDLHLDVRTMEPAIRYQAIVNGDVQVVDAYSTESNIRTYDLKVLEDDRELFPPYQGAPLMLQSTLEKYPELEDILNAFGGKITTEEMTEMNYQVDVNGRSANEVAQEYLRNEGLID